MKINGGTEIINQIITHEPLLNQVTDVSDTVEAILTYLGVDTIRLSARALEMLIRIRRANENNQDNEEVAEYISDNDNTEL